MKRKKTKKKKKTMNSRFCGATVGEKFGGEVWGKQWVMGLPSRWPCSLPLKASAGLRVGLPSQISPAGLTGHFWAN